MHTKEKQQSNTSPAETKGGRRPTGGSAGENGKSDPEVVAQLSRRRLTFLAPYILWREKARRCVTLLACHKEPNYGKSSSEDL